MGLGDLQGVEFDSFGEGSALSDRDDIADFDVSEAGGQMNGHVLVPLLEPVVFPNVVEVIASDDDGPVHLHFGDDSGQDTATDMDVAGEGALLVDVGALTSLKESKYI